MCHQLYKRRPTCAELLSEYSKWGIDDSVIKNLDDYEVTNELVKTNKFFDHYLKSKLQEVKLEMRTQSILVKNDILKNNLCLLIAFICTLIIAYSIKIVISIIWIFKEWVIQALFRPSDEWFLYFLNKGVRDLVNLGGYAYLNYLIL